MIPLFIIFIFSPVPIQTVHLRVMFLFIYFYCYLVIFTLFHIGYLSTPEDLIWNWLLFI